MAAKRPRPQLNQDKITQSIPPRIADQQISSLDDPDFAKRLAETLRPYLRNPAESEQAITSIVEVTESYSGPTPPVDYLERVDKISPGSAKQIINMAISEQRHRHRMSSLVVLYPYFGMFTGFIVALTCFFLAYKLGITGHEKIAATFVGVSAIGVIGWFIRSRLAIQTSELNTQAPENPAGRQQRRK